jgi:hypothetical protein
MALPVGKKLYGGAAGYDKIGLDVPGAIEDILTKQEDQTLDKTNIIDATNEKLDAATKAATNAVTKAPTKASSKSKKAAAQPAITPPTEKFKKGLPTPNCINSAITYVNTKLGMNDTTLDNVVDRLIEIVNARGFPNLTMDSLKTHIGLLTSAGKVSSTGSGKKLEIHHPDDYQYSDLSRFTIFNGVASWTTIPFDKINPGDLRAPTAYESALDTNTGVLERKLDHIFFTEWEKGNDRSPTSECSDVELDFIIEIAIQRASNISKDTKLRDFIEDNLTGNDKIEMAAIKLRIRAETQSPKKPDPLPPKQIRTTAQIATDVATVKSYFTSKKFRIIKRPCGICHICQFPIYIYQIEHTSGKTEQLNTCGEMEHVFPPGFGSIVGTLSARHPDMAARIATVSNASKGASQGASQGGQRGGIAKEELDRAEDVLAKFSLRASHAWCNKIKSDLIFLMVTMVNYIVQGFEFDQARIDAFETEVIRVLSNPDEQLLWNYELQFKSGFNIALAQNLYPNPTTQSRVQFPNMYAELRNPTDFAQKCGENAKALMTEFSTAATTVNKASFEEVLGESDDTPISIQIKLRTIMYSVIYWHDVLVNSKNLGATTYMQIWNNYLAPAASAGGGKYKQKGGVMEELNNVVDTYITDLDKIFIDIHNTRGQVCDRDTNDNPFDEVIDKYNKAAKQIVLTEQRPQPMLKRALSQVERFDRPEIKPGVLATLKENPKLFATVMEDPGQQDLFSQLQPWSDISRNSPSAAASSSSNNANFGNAFYRSSSAAASAASATPFNYQSGNFRSAVPVSMSKSAAAPFGQQMQPAASSSSSSAANGRNNNANLRNASSSAASSAAPTSFREIHNRSSSSAAPILGRRKSSNSNSSNNINNNDNNGNSPNMPTNERGIVHEETFNGKRKKLKGGTRKQRKLHKQRKQTRNRHRNGTRKQKKNKSTRKIKKLTKRF